MVIVDRMLSLTVNLYILSSRFSDRKWTLLTRENNMYQITNNIEKQNVYDFVVSEMFIRYDILYAYK